MDRKHVPKLSVIWYRLVDPMPNQSRNPVYSLLKDPYYSNSFHVINHSAGLAFLLKLNWIDDYIDAKRNHYEQPDPQHVSKTSFIPLFESVDKVYRLFLFENSPIMFAHIHHLRSHR